MNSSLPLQASGVNRWMFNVENRKSGDHRLLLVAELRHRARDTVQITWIDTREDDPMEPENF